MAEKASSVSMQAIISAVFEPGIPLQNPSLSQKSNHEDSISKVWLKKFISF
jgi:hypothetical protein